MKLRAHTPEELAELERIRAEYARAAEIQAKLAARKVQADREAPHFALRPNDEPQRDLFS